MTYLTWSSLNILIEMKRILMFIIDGLLFCEGYLKRTCDGQELSLPSYSQETSSYTSIYTWTTATNSAPKTGSVK